MRSPLEAIRIRRRTVAAIRAIERAPVEDLERIRLEIAVSIDWPPTAEKLLELVDARHARCNLTLEKT